MKQRKALQRSMLNNHPRHWSHIHPTYPRSRRHFVRTMPDSSQQTQNICVTFIQCWTNVEDVGSTLYKCYTNVFFVCWVANQLLIKATNRIFAGINSTHWLSTSISTILFQTGQTFYPSPGWSACRKRDVMLICKSDSCFDFIPVACTNMYTEFRRTAISKQLLMLVASALEIAEWTK